MGQVPQGVTVRLFAEGFPSRVHKTRAARRRLYRVEGLAPSLQYHVYTNSVNNLTRAVAERSMYTRTADGLENVVKPVDGQFRGRLEQFRRRLLCRVPSTTQITRDEFPTIYQGRKRTMYERAVESLGARGVDERDSNPKLFVKAEKVAIKGGGLPFKSLPAPRVISARTPRYNVEVGVSLRPLEPHLYVGIARVFGGRVVTKGLNAKGTGNLIHEKWIKFRNPVAVSLDASRFDQHVSVDALRWEHSIYNACFRDPQLARLLSWQLSNKCKGICKDGIVSYTSKGGRMSGDMNTAMGNCLLMCAMVWSYCQHVGVNIEFVNNGDDCVCMMEKADLQRFTEPLYDWFLEMGFRMEAEEPAYRIEHIEFCQGRPVYTPEDGYIMVRNIREAMAKDVLCFLDLSSINQFRKWSAAVSDCGLSLCGGIPIMAEFYRAFGRAGKFKGKNKILSNAALFEGMFKACIGMNRKDHGIHADTRVSFYHAFGVTPDMQVLSEKYLSKATCSGKLRVVDYDTYGSFGAPMSFALPLATDPLQIPHLREYPEIV